MTSYVKSTNFASKDSLASGNPLKIVKGTEIDIEFNNIAVAIDTKLDSVNTALTGVPTAPTATAGTNTSQVATTAFVTAADTAAIAASAAAASAAYPTKAGVGATGTWGINITGNAASATTATNATNATNAATVTTITTAQVVGATAGVAYGAVGSYAILQCQSVGAMGSTVSGSSLQKISAGVGPINAGLTGTWRNMGPEENSGVNYVTNLWLRIA